MTPEEKFDFSDVAKVWRFTIPNNMPSLNAMRRDAWNHHVYARYRESLKLMVRAMSREAGCTEATGPRKVTITRLIDKYGKRFDLDNLIGGAKPLLDALVSEGLLLGDSESLVKVEYTQEKAEGGGTRITLEDA